MNIKNILVKIRKILYPTTIYNLNALCFEGWKSIQSFSFTLKQNNTGIQFFKS